MNHLTQDFHAESVQTVVSIWTAAQNRRLEKDKVKRGVEPGLDRETTLTLNLPDRDVDIHPFMSHSDLVMRFHGRGIHPFKVATDDVTDKSNQFKINESGPLQGRISIAHPGELQEGLEHVARDHRQEMELLDELLGQVLSMEELARKMLINHLDHAGKPRLLLQADKNLMDRAQCLLLDPTQQQERGDAKTTTCATIDSLTDLEQIQ